MSRLRAARGLPLIGCALLLAVAALLWMSGGDGGGTELEARMAQVLSKVEGAGRVRVLIVERDVDDTNFGVVIVAEGAKDLRVALTLGRAAQTLMGAEAVSVEVLPMGRGG